MADSTKNTKTTDESAFFPEDAQERNFRDARETSVRNHEKDLSTRTIGDQGTDYVKKTDAVEVINPVAKPVVSVEDEDKK